MNLPVTEGPNMLLVHALCFGFIGFFSSNYKRVKHQISLQGHEPPAFFVEPGSSLQYLQEPVLTYMNPLFCLLIFNAV
jgi:hypothetical protein